MRQVLDEAGDVWRAFGLKNETIIPVILEWTHETREIQRLSFRKEELYREAMEEGGISPLRGVPELLALLRSEDVPCAVGSSTHRRNIEAALKLIGLGDSFRAIVAAEDVGVGKPDPEVFLRGAERIGVPPERCVVFEDAESCPRVPRNLAAPETAAPRT